MHLPIIDSLPPENELGRPEGLEGWIDVEHMKKLSASEKATITKLQRENGLVETEF